MKKDKDKEGCEVHRIPGQYTIVRYDRDSMTFKSIQLKVGSQVFCVEPELAEENFHKTTIFLIFDLNREKFLEFVYFNAEHAKNKAKFLTKLKNKEAEKILLSSV